MHRYFLLALLLSSQLAAAPLGMAQVSAGCGYAFGTLRKPHTHYRVAPLYVRCSWSLKQLCGWEQLTGDLQLGVEPAVNIIINPEAGVEVASLIMLQYLYPLGKKWRLQVESGTGPSYLSIDTRNQGHAGFNFLNQGGGTLHWLWREGEAINVGYRYRHMSHGSTRNSANSGIDSHAFVVGLARFY